MGSWTIVINGHGQHDNNQANDIEQLLAAWLAKIKGSQTADSVTLTIGTGRKQDPTGADHKATGTF